MASKKFVVRFTLPGGQVDVVMFEDEARALLRRWMSGEMVMRGHPRIGDEDAPGPWGVKADAVCAVQLMPVQDQPAQQGYQAPPGIRQG